MSEARPPSFPDASSIDPAPGIATAEAAEALLEPFNRPLRVLVAGGTGFIGRHLVRRLVARGHSVRVLCRDAVVGAAILGPGAEVFGADVTEPSSLRGRAERCEVIVHLVGPVEVGARGRGEPTYAPGTENLLREGEQAGARRFVFVSARGAGPASGGYLRSKFYAEGEVLRSTLEHVIIRPSVIYGPEDHFTTAIARMLSYLPLFPMPGKGAFILEPIAIEDAADALSQAVERADLANATFDLVGPERLPLARIVRLVAERLGVKRPIVRVPRWSYGALSRIVLRAGSLVDTESMMLQPGRSDPDRDNAFRSVFHIEPLPFREALADYL